MGKGCYVWSGEVIVWVREVMCGWGMKRDICLIVMFLLAKVNVLTFILIKRKTRLEHTLKLI